jgi:peptidyl-prolyl cis-trans isomerase C
MPFDREFTMIRADKLYSTALRLTCGVLLLPALLSCSPGSGEGSSQVVATVNGHEITETQLNRELESAGVREVTAATRQRAIDALAIEELLVQAALKNEIDRDAGFVQALEQSRRKLLAQLFAERVIYPKTVISATEVSDYYNQQTLLFAQRRRFRLTTFQANAADVAPAVMKELEAANSIEKVRRVLDAHGIKYTTELATVTPEQLPIDELEAFSKAAVGDLFVNPRDDGSVLLMAVAAIEDDVPMTLERARPLIEQYLQNARNQKAAAQYVAHVRANANIVYTRPADLTAPGTNITQAAPTSTEPLAAVRLEQ